MAMEYMHSHVHTEIVDNSFVSIVNDGGTVGFFPIFSEKGKENEIVNIEGSVPAFVQAYGANADKFGQAHMNVIQWLQGGGTAAVMRLLPDDATYASAGLIVNVDSYTPDYRITLSMNDGELVANEVYNVFEDFLFDGSTIKTLKLGRRLNTGKYNASMLSPENGVRIFNTGRGTVAEEPYDISEDWMRNNGFAVEDLSGELEEDTGRLPIKTYVNYNLIRDFGTYLKAGTKAFSPELVLNLLKTWGALIPDGTAFDENGYFVNGSVVTKHTDETTGSIVIDSITPKLAINIEINGNKVTFGGLGSTVTIRKVMRKDLYTIDPAKGLDPYGDPQFKDAPEGMTPDGEGGFTGDGIVTYEVEGLEFKDEFFSTKYYTKGEEDGQVYFDQAPVMDDENNPFMALVCLAGGLPDSPDTSVARKELKEKLFVNPDSINVYYSFEDTVIHPKGQSYTDGADTLAYTSDVTLNTLIDIKVEDVQFNAMYFMDGYPIEVYSEFVTVGTKTVKAWNAKITVTDSDGVTTDIPLFKSNVTNRMKDGIGNVSDNSMSKHWEPKFSQEDYIYRALNGLVHYTGKWNEYNFARTQKLRGFKFDGYFYNKGGKGFLQTEEEKKSGKYRVDETVVTAALDVIKTKYPDYGYCKESLELVNPVLWYDDEKKIFICLKDLNFDALKGANYSGNKIFSRMDADKITVELYTPPASKATSLDGITENIRNYCVNFNNNISNLLEGKKKYPLGFFSSKCKGDYYNNYKVYLTLNNNLRDTYDFRLYDLTVYDEGGVQTKKVLGPFTVALDKDALDAGGNSLYIKSILDTYAPDADFTFYDDVDANAFKNLTEDLASLFKLKHPKYTFDLNAIDPLFVPQVDENILSTGNPDYEYHSYFAVTDDETIPEDQRTLRIQGSNNISTASSIRLDGGFNLGGGSCGVLFDRRGNFIQSIYNNLLIKCFTGAINPAVMDTINNEFDVVLDAKYSNKVKLAMYKYGIALENSEGGVMTFLDTDNLGYSVKGPANTAEMAVKARKEFNPDHRSCAIFAQNTTAYDEYSSKDIPVSATYLLAFKIPSNDKSFGIQTAFVGPRRGSVQLTAPLNWYPSTAEKEKLYKAQVNYISKDPRRTAFDCQLTSQTATSALSNIPNVRVLYKIKRAVRKICDEFRFERNTGDTRNQMNSAVNDYLKTWVKNGACSQCAAQVSADDYQIKQKMCQVDIGIIFVGFLERINVTLTVNG